MAFTKKMFPVKEKMLGIFQNLFVVMIFIYSINYIGELVPIILIIVTEHLLMAAAILFVLYSGYKELKVHRNRKLDRIMAGYSMFCICSVFALGCFYFGNSVMYSVSYIIGIYCTKIMGKNKPPRGISDYEKSSMKYAIYE